MILYMVLLSDNWTGAMSKFEKALLRLRQNPKNVRYEEVESILLRLGFVMRQGGGSHVTFTIAGQRPLTVPIKKPFLKPIYVKLLLERLVEMGILEEE